jgi:hypothetical protein
MFRAADFFDLEGAPAGEARMQNAAIAYAEAAAGDVLAVDGQPVEYAVLLPDPSTAVRIAHGGTETAIDGFSVAFVPPGDSTIEVMAPGRVIRILPQPDVDGPDPAVAPLKPWPQPPGGPAVRAYSLDVPDEEGRFGRIFRCTTVMVNWLEIAQGPRDPRQLSPHSHDDFEQGSLALEGTFTHHLRWPWVPDSTQWRDDEHQTCGAPSVLVIPPGVIHTTQMTAPGRNVLVDVFCPPREDFVQRGWVLNETDYAAS